MDDGFGALFVAALLVIALIFCAAYTYGTGRTETITIAERPALEGKLVKSTDGNWYKVADSWLRLKFRSRDTWGNLEVGKTYTVSVYGWRFGPTSTYPNIVSATAVDK